MRREMILDTFDPRVTYRVFTEESQMIMRGLKLQQAIRLVAEEILTESEMAAHLNVSVGTLLRLSRDPIFTRRVRAAEKRATLAAS